MTNDEHVTMETFVRLQDKMSRLIEVVRDQDKEIAFLMSRVTELEVKISELTYV